MDQGMSGVVFSVVFTLFVALYFAVMRKDERTVSGAASWAMGGLGVGWMVAAMGGGSPQFISALFIEFADDMLALAYISIVFGMIEVLVPPRQQSSS